MISIGRYVNMDLRRFKIDPVHLSFSQYPEYDFKKHKGYPTKEHYERLTEYGISPVHRRSFLKKFTGGRS